MRITRRILALATVLSLTACGITDQYNQEYDELGKKVVAEVKQQQGVADAEYSYVHGIDQGQGISVNVTLSSDANSADMPGKLMEIAQRNYWLGVTPPGGPTMSVRVWSAEPPHPQISLEQVDVSDTAALEKKYGPRPKKK
ncbi:hypothetical protein C8D87_102599 [Lentzea atacamensis]|uniref:Lipoprotein n=1 Tax=Lentzea atacamensis TaxID=531938 RepID=A0ABX9EDU2_9PSEU|nr:hypothetical protein [Lentzea atacamensis]RAS68530.1 hypothetical protein C8D87_102599 [Lentzea atacamensis]